MNTLIDFCSKHMANESFSAEQARQYLTAMLPGLKYWREKIAEQKNK
ncbi:MAG: zinc ribbon domain-containing protein [Oscillospiraceae bacterium]|nr:zinc ribbon domain-containing protein [Oscillospiraceae bacterium]